MYMSVIYLIMGKGYQVCAASEVRSLTFTWWFNNHCGSTNLNAMSWNVVFQTWFQFVTAYLFLSMNPDLIYKEHHQMNQQCRH